MTVSVTARALLYDKSAEIALVGSVFRQDDKRGDVFVSDILLPMVDYKEDYTRLVHELDEAEPGNYLLQLRLPNGKTKTTNFEISPDRDTQIILDVPHEGPHEWTAFHAMTGQFQKEMNQIKGFDYTITDSPRLYSELRITPQTGYSLSLLSQSDNANAAISQDGLFLNNLSALISADLDVQTALARFGAGKDIDQPSWEDNNLAMFRLSHSGVLPNRDSDDEYFYFGPGTDLDRHYLVQSSAQGATLICLPTPWMTHNGQTEVELLVKKNPVDEQLDYSITVADPLFNTVLGYINSGAIHQAAKLVNFQQAERMLFEKMSSPFAASVGGYLLVLGLNRSTYLSKANDWKNWVENLDHWFEWMPDGAILHAALYFILGDGDRDDAYDALLRAYSRGLPFFTFGLKLMIDGMRYFANEGMAEAKEFLPQLESIVMQADPSQPFLCVDFSRKWQ